MHKVLKRAIEKCKKWKWMKYWLMKLCKEWINVYVRIEMCENVLFVFKWMEMFLKPELKESRDMID